MSSIDQLILRIILIGMLPKSDLRDELIAAYREERALAALIPAGLTAERELTIGDVESLAPAAQARFLKGAALILGPGLRNGFHCICNMPAAVMLPVAAFVSLLRADVGRARKAWPAFAKIPRLCAERLPLGPDVQLEQLTFEEFVVLMASEELPYRGDFAQMAKAAAAKIDEAFDLAARRRNVP
mgnify:CR=1 FL=1